MDPSAEETHMEFEVTGELAPEDGVEVPDEIEDSPLDDDVEV